MTANQVHAPSHGTCTIPLKYGGNDNPALRLLEYD